MNESFSNKIDDFCNAMLKVVNNYEVALNQKRKDIDANLENDCQEHFGISYAEFGKLDCDGRFKLLTKNIN